MIDFSLYSDKGDRDNNEDYIGHSQYKDEHCFVICDGLGGHEKGEVASYIAGTSFREIFERNGNYDNFIEEAFSTAQNNLFDHQEIYTESKGMKTTGVILVITPELIQWGFIGDSRLYHFYNDFESYERTKDHSLTQILVKTGEITENEMRNHPDRNKLLRAFGSQWQEKKFEISPVLEYQGKKAFLMATDGFWENIFEDEMISALKQSKDAKDWMNKMMVTVNKNQSIKRQAGENNDNFSAITIITKDN